MSGRWLPSTLSGASTRVKISSINTTYNCGLTHFDLRYENAKKPLNVCSFKPSEKKAWDKFEKVVNPNIIKHFKKHELL